MYFSSSLYWLFSIAHVFLHQKCERGLESQFRKCKIILKISCVKRIQSTHSPSRPHRPTVEGISKRFSFFLLFFSKLTSADISRSLKSPYLCVPVAPPVMNVSEQSKIKLTHYGKVNFKHLSESLLSPPSKKLPLLFKYSDGELISYSAFYSTTQNRAVSSGDFSLHWRL